MELLELLASCIEQGRTAIAPMLVEPTERERLDRLHKLGAMMQSRAETIFCPRCEARSVRVIVSSSAYCIDCGQITLTPKDLLRLTPDGDWLRRRIAQALDLASESALMVVPGRVWRLGDIGRPRARHRVLFGQQLADVMVQRVLLSAWPSYVGEIPAILVNTTPLERIFLPGVQIRLVPLAAAFRVRGGGLIADEAVWASTTTPPRDHATSVRQGPFARDFSDVLLPGETAPIPLTKVQAAIFRVLWRRCGTEIDRDLLIQEAGVAVEKPIDAFPRNKYPGANRAYRALVRSSPRGRYWLPRDGLESLPQ